jgi:glyoxylase-like metal-dependent hydrolase (beta-lactamase superfamily II)
MEIDKVIVGPLSANCYIIQLEKKVMVIDPGAEAKKIISLMDSKNLKPDFILNTHGHFDHIGAVKAIQEKYGIEFYIDPGDEEIVTNPVKNGSSIFGQNNLSLNTYHLIDESVIKFLAGNGIEIINTPGHSPGCIVLKIGENLFTGDLIFRGSIGRTDLAGGSMHDMKKSLLKIKGMEGFFKIFPGHGQETDLEYEKTNNYYLGDSVLF